MSGEWIKERHGGGGRCGRIGSSIGSSLVSQSLGTDQLMLYIRSIILVNIIHTRMSSFTPLDVRASSLDLQPLQWRLYQ